MILGNFAKEELWQGLWLFSLTEVQQLPSHMPKICSLLTFFFLLLDGDLNICGLNRMGNVRA